MENELEKAKPRPSLKDWEAPLASHRELNRLGYVWHPGIGLLFCLKCRTTLSAGGLKRHSSSFKSHDLARDELTTFVDKLAEGCPYGEREGRLPRVDIDGKLPPLPYLDKVFAYPYPGCDRHYEQLESLKRHWRKAHTGARALPSKPVHCQILIKGKYGLMFEIDDEAPTEPKSAVISAASIGQQIQLELARVLQDKFRSNWESKDTWPYLRDVPWHLVLENNCDRFDIEQLKAMVTIPPIHMVAARGTLATSLAVLVEATIGELETNVLRASYTMKLLIGAEKAR